jgi:hypothetical protein
MRASLVSRKGTTVAATMTLDAPAVPEPASVSAEHRSLAPTNKWIVTQITAVTALLTAYVQLGGWDKQLTIALIGLVAQALIGYIAPNAPTPGGVRLKKQ